MDTIFTALAGLIGALLCAAGLVGGILASSDTNLGRWKIPALVAAAAVLFFGLLILLGSLSAIGELLRLGA